MSTGWPSLAQRLTPGQVERYLGRIGYRDSCEPTAETLRALQRRHLVAVPFENVHVCAGLPVRTDLDWSYAKIVEQHRGGWCYEVNGAFGALLAGLGFDVRRTSARVWDSDSGSLGPELDHLCLLVEAGGRRWLVDVGFGDSSIEPLEVPAGDGVVEGSSLPRRSRLVRTGDRLSYRELVDGEWTLQYVVTDASVGLAAFSERSEQLRRGEGSARWVDKPFATRALDASGARVWLRGDRLKLRDTWGMVTEHAVEPEGWSDTLWSWFALTSPSVANRPHPVG